MMSASQGSSQRIKDSEYTAEAYMLELDSR
jgi:hypothetical protein